jgi:hypothetical protein
VPTVGKGKGAKHFPYDKPGMAAAKKESVKTGQPMSVQALAEEDLKQMRGGREAPPPKKKAKK